MLWDGVDLGGGTLISQELPGGRVICHRAGLIPAAPRRPGAGTGRAELFCWKRHVSFQLPTLVSPRRRWSDKAVVRSSREAAGDGEPTRLEPTRPAGRLTRGLTSRSH